MTSEQSGSGDGHDYNVREAEDPHYLRSEKHILTGKGMYCPDEQVFFYPEPGSSTGDRCPMCEQVVQI